MPILDNPRHERFAQHLATGAPAAEAYRVAGYKDNDSNSARLNGNERVRARVREILMTAAQTTMVTIESLGAELDEARYLALFERNPSALVSAVMGKAKLYGYLKDRIELGGKVGLANAELFEKMTSDERAGLRAMLVAAAARLPKPANQNAGEQAGVVPNEKVSAE